MEEDKHGEEKISYTGSRNIYPANPAHQSQKKNKNKKNSKLFKIKELLFFVLCHFFLSRIKGNI